MKPRQRTVEMPAATGRVREFEFTDTDFNSLRQLAREVAGISLADCKRELIYSRLSRRLRHHGLTAFADYREMLAGADGQAELREFTNAVTTNLTAFFRERHHFDYLRDILKARAAEPQGSRRMRIWCAAASTGEEAWSVAMTVADAIPDWHRWDIRVLATDLDTNVLCTAELGAYAPERVGQLAPGQLERHFFRQGNGAEYRYQVKPELARMVTFRQLNLTQPLPLKGPLDVIFCRNVIIYFDKETQRELFQRLAPLQRPGDVLFLGHSEGLFKVSGSWSLIGRTIYRRSGPC
jgi:chemotaxis protein methyltransferase CheR